MKIKGYSYTTRTGKRVKVKAHTRKGRRSRKSKRGRR